MEKNKRLDLASIASIPLIMTLGNSMLIPVLPTMEKELGITNLQSSMIITLYSVVAIFLIPIAGYLSDRIGRKKVIVPSLLIAGIGGAVSGWAAWQMDGSYAFILAGRVLQGVGAAGASPIVLPLVGDMFKNERDVSEGLGLIETSNTFGKVVSPILGAALAGVIWYLPFFSIPLFSVVSLIMVIFLVKSPKKQEEPKQFKAFMKDIKNVFKNNGRWLYAIFAIGGLLMLILFGILFYLSSMLEDQYNITGIYKGLVLAIPLAALCIASYLTGKRIKQNKVLMKWITFFSLLLLSITAFGTIFFEQLVFVIASLFISGISIGASLPCLDALITEGIEKEERGTVTSIYSSMRFVGVAVGPPLFSILMKVSHPTIFMVVSGLAVISLLLSLFAIKPSKEKAKTKYAT